MADREYPPILDVPVSKSFRDLKETSITLMFDEPKETSGKWGPQFMYRVEVDGVEHTLFASQALHRLMQEHNPVKGTTLSIARVGEAKDTKWDVVYVSGPTNGGAKPAAANGGVPARRGVASPEGFVNDLALYWLSFELAWDTLKGKGITPQVDANAIAFVIYKLAKDHGVEDPSNPMASVPTETSIAESEAKAKMRTELENLFLKTRLDSKHWMAVLNAHAPEGHKQIIEWDDVTRDVGLAVYAVAKNVQEGLTTWAEVMDDVAPRTDHVEPPF